MFIEFQALLEYCDCLSHKNCCTKCSIFSIKVTTTMYVHYGSKSRYVTHEYPLKNHKIVSILKFLLFTFCTHTHTFGVTKFGWNDNTSLDNDLMNSMGILLYHFPGEHKLLMKHYGKPLGS